MKTHIAMIAVLVAAGCGKKKGDSDTDKASGDKPAGDKAAGDKPAGDKPAVDLSGPCPALKITVDGAPLEAAWVGQGVTMVSGSYTTQMVRLYNHDKATCEEALSGRHNVQDNEISVRAWHGAAPGVGIDAYTHVQGTLTLDKVTDKVGEDLVICVRAPVEFTPNAGAYSGKKVSIVGTFTGKYCGVNKQ
ncbi:MAG: hypothetical protein JNL83_13770 [Myxococcales bacterium]|nr:hypothetical protein [Myxococcales bacterium]